MTLKYFHVDPHICCFPKYLVNIKIRLSSPPTIGPVKCVLCSNDHHHHPQGPDPEAETELSRLLFQMTFLYFEHPSQV